VRRLLRLYPAWWRRRYGEEVEAVLEELEPTPRLAIDLVRGAVDAWIHPRRGARMTEPYRRVPAIPAYLALLAPTLFLFTVLLKYGLGVPRPFDRLEGFWTSAVGEAVVLAGPVLALALSALAIVRVDLHREEASLVGRLSLRFSARHLVVLVLSLAFLALFGVYFVSENLLA
jgi:hypothetical protein